MKTNESIYRSLSEKLTAFQGKVRTLPDALTLNRILGGIDLTEEEFVALYSDQDAFRLLSVFGRFYEKSLMESFLLRYPEHGDKILAANSIESWQVTVLKKGYFSDLKAYNDAALSSRIKIAEIGVRCCDFQTLKKLTTHKSKLIREIVFKRLGPIDSLNEMLEDPSSTIRSTAVSIAPVGYPKLNEMKDDVAMEVVSELVSRIDASRLPFMMGNRNVGEKNVSSQMDLRMRIKRRSS